MLDEGRFLWNAGIFMFRPDALIAAFETHAPDMVEPCREAVAAARPDLGFLRLDEAAYARAPENSIDYAIMEKAADVAVVPVDCGWSDLGAWDAVWREMGPDAAGVSLSGAVTQIDCTDTLLRSEEDGPRLVGVGLDGIAVVAMRDAVLVAAKSDLQAVKAAVAKLKAEGVREAETLPRTYRPWGWYETLALGPRFQVKQIMVPPGKKLSLQSHVHRSEHWVVVQGTATVTVDDEVKLVTENQSVYIPLGAVHRLENPGKVDLHLIEVQTGSYLGEDDIIRYEDVYNRA
jgi:mannose-1-phosphate guanylyltransferase/mannose-6-phosphate isomerase